LVQNQASPAFQAEDPRIQTFKDGVRIEEIEQFRKDRDEFFRSHPRSPLKDDQKKRFPGLVYYPIDLNWHFSGKIRRYRFHMTNPKYYARFLTNKGTYKRYVRYGAFSFKLGGKEYELEVYKSILSDNLFVPFRDRTNGEETYTMGRYVDAEILPGYYTAVDFNKAYNPSCVYNSKYVCVIPPEKNSLDIEIRAGEKNYP
jgi:uncharacterized protein (DUF1684 family)